MLKLFGTSGTTDKHCSAEVVSGRYTRFSNHHQRTAPVAPDRTIIEQTQKPEPIRTLPVTAQRPIVQEASAPSPRVNDKAHLHEEAQVPVSVLRRALPQRFEEIERDVANVLTH